MMKKLLAILVAIALVFSFIPSVFATEEAENYNYVFNSSAHDLGENPTTAERRLISGLHSIDNMSENTSSAAWGFVNGYKFNALATYSGYMNWGLSDDKKAGVVFAPGEEDVAGVRAALAFEISASTGVYDASLSVSATDNPTELEVYLVPKNATNSFVTYDSNNADASKESFYRQIEGISANYRIGKIDLYGKNGEVYIGRTALSQSNYYLVLVPCGANENIERNGSWAMTLKNFKLDGVSSASMTAQDITASISTMTKSTDSWSYSNKFTAKQKNNVLTVSDACIYAYGNATDRIPLVAMEFTANATGNYNLQFKTDTNGISIKKFAAAPLVSCAKYNDVFFDDMTNSSTSENDSLTEFKKLEGYSEIGYFDFSELAEADKYYDVKTIDPDSDENAVLVLEAGEKYILAFSLDSDSLALSSGTIERGIYEGGTATGNEVVTEYKTKPSSGTHAYQAYIISGIKLVPVVDESTAEYIADRELYNEITTVAAENNTKNELSSYSSSATVTVVTQDIATGDSVTSDIVNENIVVNKEYNPEAPDVDEYEFLYWSVGIGANRKIVSFDKDDYSFRVAPGRNMVYAIYRNKTATDKYAFFFDGSGTVMGRKVISEGRITLPELPGARPGYGLPSGWKYTGEENEEALQEAATVVDLTDDTFFVASYSDEQKVTVTINGTEYEFEYGEDVNLGDYAWARENKSGENVFNYWKKGNEIISFEPDYSFKAYESCVLTSEYAKYEPINKEIRKILISSDSSTGITFAEFLGLDSAVEKGILFGDAKATYENASVKAAMQTDGNVFAIVNETGKTAIGYAILVDGCIVYSDR